MTAHNFKDLKVWQMSIDITKEVYDLTSTFPTDEKWGLTSQIRRCAVSIPSNIAEGSYKPRLFSFSWNCTWLILRIRNPANFS